MSMQIEFGFWVQCPGCDKGIYVGRGGPENHDCGYGLTKTEFIQKMKDGYVTIAGRFSCPKCDKEQIRLFDTHSHKQGGLIVNSVVVKDIKCSGCGMEFSPCMPGETEDVLN